MYLDIKLNRNQALFYVLAIESIHVRTMLVIALLLLSSLTSRAFCSVNGSFNFSFSSFDSQSCGNDSILLCMGSVSAKNGSLNLTPDTEEFRTVGKDTPSNLVGRVLYRHPVFAWPVTFTTNFTVRIVPDNDSAGSGDGMAFIMAQDDRPSPANSFGSFMGILDSDTQGGVLRQLAVELDTYKNEFDYEPDGNHVAIDTIRVRIPDVVKSLYSTGINLKSGRDITFQISYDGWYKRFQISVAYAGEPLLSFLDHFLIMQKTVPSSVYIGFTASTGTLSETHQVIQWSFESVGLPNDSLNKNVGEHKNKKKMVLVVVVPVLVGLLTLAACTSPFLVRHLKRKKERKVRKGGIDFLTRNAANAPKMFTFKQLSKATDKFSKENLLGTGGFGSVYKGVLLNPHATIAVKKISATSTQGEREYLAEICTIGRLRHKNLVQLQGWCHDREQLLLVYEYMPNGSLDRYIGKVFLDWKTRYHILKGLASVLVYLHEECGSPVVHRDVKPNNIMLDSEFNTHLGDFGLARLLQNDTSVTTMVAGTPGYLAPEVSYTGRATPESDVYSFGMVVLEVVCGKRSRGIMEENSLVESVWDFYEKGVLLKCVDSKLGGGLEEEEVNRTLMVGLACLHPDYTFRPKMRKVVQIFMNSDEPLMSLPVSRPLAVCLPYYSSSNSNTTDFGSKKAPAEGGSKELSPDEMKVIYDA